MAFPETFTAAAADAGHFASMITEPVYSLHRGSALLQVMIDWRA